MLGGPTFKMCTHDATNEYYGAERESTGWPRPGQPPGREQPALIYAVLLFLSGLRHYTRFFHFSLGGPR